MSEHSQPSEVLQADSKCETTQPQYEFSDSENKVFSEVARTLSFTGWCTIVALVGYHGFLFARWAVQGVPIYDRIRFLQIYVPLCFLISSIYFIIAAKAFKLVVETHGSDITHLMNGLTNLASGMYRLNVVLAVVAIVGVAYALLN